MIKPYILFPYIALFIVFGCFLAPDNARAAKFFATNKKQMVQKIKPGKCFDLDLSLDLQSNYKGSLQIPFYIQQSHEKSIFSTGEDFDASYKLYSPKKTPSYVNCNGGHCDTAAVTLCMKNNRTINKLVKELKSQQKDIKSSKAISMRVIPEHDTFFYAPRQLPPVNQAILYTSFNISLKDYDRKMLLKRNIKPPDDLINYIVVFTE